jgi:hypothetical protein
MRMRKKETDWSRLRMRWCGGKELIMKSRFNEKNIMR